MFEFEPDIYLNISTSKKNPDGKFLPLVVRMAVLAAASASAVVDDDTNMLDQRKRPSDASTWMSALGSSGPPGGPNPKMRAVSTQNHPARVGQLQDLLFHLKCEANTFQRLRFLEGDCLPPLQW